MKLVKFQIAKQVAWDKPPKMLDWMGYETIIPGLYLNRPLQADETPAFRGWDVCHHKSGYKINPIELKSEKQAKRFIEILATKKLDWTLPYEQIAKDYNTYFKAIRESWETLNDNP